MNMLAYLIVTAVFIVGAYILGYNNCRNRNVKPDIENAYDEGFKSGFDHAVTAFDNTFRSLFQDLVPGQEPEVQFLSPEDFFKDPLSAIPPCEQQKGNYDGRRN